MQTTINKIATGAADYNYIIEISAVKVVGGKVTDRFETLVKPPYYKILTKNREGKRRIKSYEIVDGQKIYYIEGIIENLTGINNNMIYRAMPEKKAIEKFEKFVGDKTVVGHGIKNDLTYLNDAYLRVFKKKFKNRSIDTFDMGLFLDDTEYSLTKLCDRFHINSENMHRAYIDANKTQICYQKLVESISLKYGNRLNDEYVKWSKMLEIKNSKTLKNVMKNKINSKNWSSVYETMIDNMNKLEFLSHIYGKNIVISNKIENEEYRYIEKKLIAIGANIKNQLGFDTDFYISSNEFARNNVNLENKKLRKILGFNKKVGIKIIDKDRLLLFFRGIDKAEYRFIDNNKSNRDKKQHNNILIDKGKNHKCKRIDYGDINLKNKNVYLYNCISKEFEEDVERFFKLNNCKIVRKINYNTDIIVLGELMEEGASEFLDSKEYYLLLSLLSFGCNIILIKEYDLMEIIRKSLFLQEK